MLSVAGPLVQLRKLLRQCQLFLAHHANRTLHLLNATFELGLLYISTDAFCSDKERLCCLVSDLQKHRLIAERNGLPTGFPS
jgi:hypothetical protein